MSTGRAEILGRIRTALGPERVDVEIPRAYRATGDLGTEAMLERLVDRLVDYKATVHRCSATDLEATLRDVLRDAGRVLVPAGLAPGWAPDTATVDDGTLSASDLDGYDTVVTACAAACAETGTVVLDASPDQGRRAISLIPDRHVCVVKSEQVVATVPELLSRLDALRPLTLISGPSATSDIELQRVEGVHGPRTLVIILVVP